MKWLSVKKYKPEITENGLIIVVSESKGLQIGHYDKEIDEWFLIHYGVSNDVTHFCIPDPIEIEEE